jgi:multisubunit Na+/H+ antiporter MnhE subunit
MRGRDFIEPAVWWAVLLAFYLAIISGVSLVELLVGAATATAGAAAAVVTRRALLAADNPEKYRPRLSWLRWLVVLPVQILADSVRLLRPRGRFVELRLPADDRPAALRGFAALAVSTSPGTYVVEVVPDRNVLVLHRITERPSALERAVSG